MLGLNPNDTNQLKVNFHEELKVTWTKWMRDGLSEKNKKHALELYPRKGDFYTEALKVNTEVIPILTDIVKKQD